MGEPKIKPIRIQLSRRKGFNLQAASLAANGLPAMGCARPSKWSNVYVIGGKHPDTGAQLSRDEAIGLFREWVLPHESIIKEHLAGKNLACWCPLSSPCHADVLLELANAP